MTKPITKYWFFFCFVESNTETQHRAWEWDGEWTIRETEESCFALRPTIDFESRIFDIFIRSAPTACSITIVCSVSRIEMKTNHIVYLIQLWRYCTMYDVRFGFHQNHRPNAIEFNRTSRTHTHKHMILGIRLNCSFQWSDCRNACTPTTTTHFGRLKLKKKKVK